jgi:hypothetical protein
MTDRTAAVEPRRSTYTLLIVIAAATAAGRILATSFVYDPSLYRDENDPRDSRRHWPTVRPQPMPTFSSNDRSRWATVRALVDHGTFVVGRRAPDEPGGVNAYGDRGIVFESGWETVDKVLNPETKEFYSSKPPLLATLAAGEYWLLKRTFGWSIAQDANAVVRIILLTFNLLPTLIYWLLLARLAEQFGATDWGRLFAVAAGCFGTLLTPFLITFNNHTLGACSALFALYPVLRAWTKSPPTPTLPRKGEGSDATPSFLAGEGHSSPSPLAGEGRGGGTFIVSGFFAGLCVSMELPAAAFAALLFALLFFWSPWRTLLYFVPAALVPLAAFALTNYAALHEWAPAYEKFGGPWYEYEGSHWKIPSGTVKTGIDFAQENKVVYTFHLLLGHHGLFALTPVFLLAAAGMLAGLWRARPTPGEQRPLPRPFFAAALLVTLVVIVFYIFKTNNYGGWSVGPRWLLWLTPIWLVAMLPIADRLSACRKGRVVGYTLLAASVFSASFPALNPWRMPWLYQLLESYGWIHY